MLLKIILDIRRIVWGKDRAFRKDIFFTKSTKETQRYTESIFKLQRLSIILVKKICMIL
jgi:hypothetical protein